MSPLLSASLIGGALAAEDRGSIGFMLSQPLCGGAIVGLALGAPAEGLLVGSLVQMLFLGFVHVRGERVPDFRTGGVAGAALFICTVRGLGNDPALSSSILLWSLCVALAAAWCGGHVYRMRENRFWSLSEAASRQAARGRLGRAGAVHLSSLVVHFAGGFLLVLVTLLVGRPAVALLSGWSASLWSAPPERLFVLVPFVGIGALVRLHVFTARAFWFIAGFLVFTVFLMIRG